MSPANYQAVLFDLDGTLLDTAPDFTTSINLILTRHQRPTLKTWRKKPVSFPAWRSCSTPSASAIFPGAS